MLQSTDPEFAQFPAMSSYCSSHTVTDAGHTERRRAWWIGGDDGLFSKAIAKVHPRFKTPHVAILLNALSSEPVSPTMTFAIILAGIPVNQVVFAGRVKTA